MPRIPTLPTGCEKATRRLEGDDPGNRPPPVAISMHPAWQDHPVGAASKFGYDEVVFRDAWVAEFGPNSLDVVVDLVGGVTREHSLKALRADGRLVVIGVASGEPVHKRHR